MSWGRKKPPTCRVCSNPLGEHHDLCEAHVKIRDLQEEVRHTYQHGFTDGRRAASKEFRELALKHMASVPRHVVIQLAEEWAE